MDINKIVTTPLSVNFTTSKKVHTDTNNLFSIETHTGTKNISSLEIKTAKTLKTLSEKYDITNATFQELKKISSALYKADEISLKEHALITFDLGRATESIKQDIPSVSHNFTMYATKANKSGERNWIKEFQARADQAFGYGNIIGAQANLSIVAILQKLKH
ncbi:hypothetical protein [Paraliobacillus sp. JSM ZJ581]|uniref:hypothetical protein n=1 Tax=Paraliobacillus sp. JSM ZJ581 TaxID=3342118 RepID=UPI0035A8ADF9